MTSLPRGPGLKLLAIAVAVWGLFNAFDIGLQSQAGYMTDGKNTVLGVEPSGGAEAAGMVVGDTIISINGVGVTDRGGLAGLGRARIGESRTISVRRDAQLQNLEIRYQPLSSNRKLAAWLSLLPGFSFLGFGVAAWLLNPRHETRTLAFAGIGCSLVFLSGPAISHPLLASFFSVVRSGLVLAGFAAMLHFLLVYPAPGSYVQQQRNIRLLYVPALLFWVLVSYRALIMADALSTATYVFSGLVTAFYLLAGVIVFLRRFILTTPEERTDSGMNLVLWGSLLGFVPAAVGFMPVFSSLPGSNYLYLSMTMMPAFWAMAATRCFAKR